MTVQKTRQPHRSKTVRLCRKKRIGVAILLITILLTNLVGSTVAQSGHTLFGDVKVDESKTDGLSPMSLDLLLYNLGGLIVARQRVSTNGRYRFLGLRPGEYDLVVEVENAEVARIRVTISGGAPTDNRQDLEFEWKPGFKGNLTEKKRTVSAADFYKRAGANQSLFEKGQAAVDNKKYSEAVAFFRQLLAQDQQDFQAWTELGTAYFLSDKKDDAEKAYVEAIKVRPTFALAQMNLGRVRVVQKKFEEAIPPLSTAVELNPASAEANYQLGEAYLQIKKGSKAVGYLNEAARLGRAEAHLRLASLYNAAGMKDKAAFEYEEFLKKKPDYPDRKKLEQYINENKKS
ncbi:MAG TPA: tetratricopeptide repeat protein [Pyrinomonadaceae bacterium]|jgi:Flp pilus assembly protein TadD